MTLEKEWPSVEAFLDELKNAITEEMADIRYTDFNRSGVFRRVTVTLPDGESVEVDALVDKIGRVVLPGEERYGRVKSVAFEQGDAKEVLRREARYEDEQVGAWVLYLEGDHDDLEAH